MTLLIIFLFGLAVGSFLNVVIIRGRRHESLGGRSRCELCKTVLSAVELLPLASFFLQQGRCRHCKTSISWQYPLVELGTAALYALAWQAWHPMLQSATATQALIFLSVLAGIGAAVVILVSDIRYKVIPDSAVLTLAGVGVVIHLSHPQLLLSTIVVALFLSLLLASIWFFSKGKAMGLGDAKLILATSLLTGYPNSLVAFLFSFWLGGIAGALLLASRQKTLRDQIPFGPFIIAGAALAYLWGGYFLTLTGLTAFL